MYTIERKFSFAASHWLDLDYASPCSNIHGHNYTVWLKIATNNLNHNDMVIDFSELKEFDEYLKNEFDHKMIISKEQYENYEHQIPTNIKTINDNPTAEVFAKHFVKIAEEMFFENLSDPFSITITISETENNLASYTKYYKKYNKILNELRKIIN